MKLMVLLMVLAFCLASAACRGPVAEVKAFLDAKDDALVQMAKKIEANPTAAGVDEARKVFEARKGDLKAKRDALDEQHLEKYGDLTSMMLNSAVTDMKMFDAMRAKIPDYDTGQKVSALEKDFKAVVR
jgi:hypothetical protein